MASLPPRDSAEETGTHRASSEGQWRRHGKCEEGGAQSLVSLPSTPPPSEKLWDPFPLDVITFRKDGGRKASYVPLFTYSLGWPRVEGHHKSLQPSPDPRTWLQEQKEGHGDSACRAGYLKGESQGLPLLPDTD